MKQLQSIPLPPRSRLLDGMPHSDILRLFRAIGARAIAYDKGEAIIRQGAPLNHFWLMVTGEAHAHINSGQGKRIVASYAGPGDTFGLLFAFSGLAAHPTLMVAVKDSIVVEIPVLDAHDGVAGVERDLCLRFVSNMMAVMSHAAFVARFRAFAISFKTVEERIMAYLSRKSRLLGRTEFDIPFDRQELADFLNVDRSTLSARLGAMKSAGAIDFRKNHFRLIAPIANDDYC